MTLAERLNELKARRRRHGSNSDKKLISAVLETKHDIKTKLALIELILDL